MQSSIDGQLMPMPINVNTLNRLFNLNLSCQEAQKFMASLTELCASITSSRDVVVIQIGREL